MRLRILFPIAIFTALAFGQTNPTYLGAVGWCHLGGQAAVTQGLATSGTQPLAGSPFEKGSGIDASYPKCTITVFPTGQTSPAAIFSTSVGGVLSNPFTANVDGSFQFFVLPGCYDITESSGITTGSFMPTSHTDSDMCFGTGGNTTAACPTNILGALAYASGAGVLLCDNALTTDTHGNATGQSFTAIAPWNGDSTVTSVGTPSPFALPPHTWAWTAPGVMTTSIRNVVPNQACGIAQTLGVLNQTTDATGTLNVNWQCANFSSGVSITASSPIVVTPSPLTGTGVISCPTCSTGNAQVIQVNGTPITTESPANFQNGSASFGFNSALTNPSAGNIPVGVTVPYTKISTPSAPTLTVNGSAGSTTICYEVVADEDTNGHTTGPSSSACVTNANSTLTNTNSITLTLYGSTIYGAKCFDIYRISTNGVSPTTTGKIASCAGKSFKDGGLAGDSTTPSATNTTELHPSFDSNHNCNTVPDAPRGVDGPPCTPTADDDEFNQTFGAPGDVNNPRYTWVNQNSATASWSGGELVLNAPDRGGSNNLNCLTYPAPSTPYIIKALLWYNQFTAGINADTGTGAAGSALGLGDGTKLETVGLASTSASGNGHARPSVGKWTNTTTASSAPNVGTYGSENSYLGVAVQDDGTNVAYYTSSDNVTWVKQFTELRGAFFTTGPNVVEFCIDNNSLSNFVGFDYIRKQTSLP